MVHIATKGGLLCCDNWRGISVLDVVGKIIVIGCSRRGCMLQVIAEFMCSSRIPCKEHEDSLFTIFVDLRKAYDSVPREALWWVLEKCGVSFRLLRMVKSFHEDFQAEFIIELN